jgi:hypothetical protein
MIWRGCVRPFSMVRPSAAAPTNPADRSANPRICGKFRWNHNTIKAK